jgi:hypothetical protein
MKRFSLVAAAGAVALLAPLGAAASAQAAASVPFTINEQTTLGPDGQPVLQTFTATRPLCPEGTYVDTVQATQPDHAQGPGHSGQFTLIVRSVYTCDDGSGTFNALKGAHRHLQRPRYCHRHRTDPAYWGHWRLHRSPRARRGHRQH